MGRIWEESEKGGKGCQNVTYEKKGCTNFFKTVNKVKEKVKDSIVKFSHVPTIQELRRNPLV